MPGAKCWAHFVGSYGLPEGLEDRTPLVVESWNTFTGTARDAGGKVWELKRVQIDTGFIYPIEGEDRHERDPACAEYFRHVVRELAAVFETRPDAWTRDIPRATYEDHLSRTRWYLERNGYDPDGPTASDIRPRLSGSTAATPAPNPRLPVREGGNGPQRMRS